MCSRARRRNVWMSERNAPAIALVALLRLLRRCRAARRGRAARRRPLLGFGGLGLAFGLVALDARLLHARVLGLALLVVALLLGDLVGGLGLRFVDLLLRLGLILGVLGIELGLGDLLLAFRLGHADVLGVALHRVALGLVGLGLRLDLLFLHVLRLALGSAGAGRGGLLGARFCGVGLGGRGLRALRLGRGSECERDCQGHTSKFQFHR